MTLLYTQRYINEYSQFKDLRAMFFRFCPRSLLKNLHPDLIDQIPGRQTDRKTPLGELNWIFTAITDTIAWNVLPRGETPISCAWRLVLSPRTAVRHHANGEVSERLK